MKVKTAIILTLILLTLTTACNQSVLNSPIDRKTPMFESASQAQIRSNAIAAARETVALKTGLDLEIIEFLRYEPVTWDNLCLDFPDPNEICPTDTVDGYVFFLCRQ